MRYSEKLTKLDPLTRSVFTAAFPTYRGRTFRYRLTESPMDVRSYWDGGSRDYFAIVRLADRAVLPIPAQSGFDRALPGADAVPMRPGFAIVEHSIFCGKDLGLTLYLHPADVQPGMLPAAATAQEG